MHVAQFGNTVKMVSANGRRVACVMEDGSELVISRILDDI